MTGKELKIRRVTLDLTQTQLAKILGVQQNAIWRWETDKVQIPQTVELAMQTVERDIDVVRETYLRVEKVAPENEIAAEGKN